MRVSRLTKEGLRADGSQESYTADDNADAAAVLTSLRSKELPHDEVISKAACKLH